MTHPPHLPSNDDPILQVSHLHVAYGGIKAVKGISLTVGAHELVTLIGANGAGKSSTLRAISGLQAYQGKVRFGGADATGVPPHERLRLGLVMVPEGRGIFARMTVAENLQMGAYARRDSEAILADIDAQLQSFPRLKERYRQLAGTLSGGEQQMLAMARALISRPKLLMLDEPSMGLSPIMVDKIFEVIRAAAAGGMPILLVEQNAKLALEAADRAYVLDSGEVTLSGAAQDLLHDPRVRASYLGE